MVCRCGPGTNWWLASAPWPATSIPSWPPRRWICWPACQEPAAPWCPSAVAGSIPRWPSASAAASLLRTDKTSVVADAIRLITALRAENGQLKQLNKFMEQRLASVERERAELMMRAAYAAGIASSGGAGAGAGAGAGGVGNGGGGASCSAALPPLPSSDAAAAAGGPGPPLDAAAAVAMLPPPWLPSSDLDTSLDGSKRPPAA